MASRSIANQLLRLLDSLAAPVCLFDEERRLVFANQACADWAGVPLDQLVGQTAAYTSSAATRDSAAIDRLCPPPDVFTGLRQSGLVFAISPAGQLLRRRADFVPLDAGDHASGTPVLVVCTATDLDGEDSSSAGGSRPSVRVHDDAQLLHERLMRFQETQNTRYRLDRLVGDSAAMRLARSQVRAAIVSRASAAVVGPSGSGREHLARTIHYGSVESARTGEQSPQLPTLLPLDGSLLTGEILDSAINTLSAQGRAATATILLLHVDRLPLEIQPEIVRLFVQRVGGPRFLATSEVSPQLLAEQDRLHPQLAAAMSTLVISLPPLADRRDDVPLLAQLALEELNAARAKQLRGFAAEAIDALVAYPWPGEVAELRSFVAEAFARADGLEITTADLPRRLSYAAGAARRPPRPDEPIVLEEFLTKIERELIERALQLARGNKTQAARLLGLTRPRLYRRMVQLGLEDAAATPGRAIASPPVKRRTTTATRRPKRVAANDRLTSAAASAVDADNAPADEDAEFIEDIPFEEQPE